MRPWLLWLILIIPGIVGFLVFGYYAVLDYVALRQAYAQFDHAAQSAVMTNIVIAEAKQNIHRLNVFAEGVWSLLSLLIAAVGLHGISVKTKCGE